MDSKKKIMFAMLVIILVSAIISILLSSLINAQEITCGNDGDIGNTRCYLTNVNKYQECYKNWRGNFAWRTLSCGNYQICNDSSGSAICICNNQCAEGEMKCDGERYRNCEKDLNGCWRLSGLRRCPTNEICVNDKCAIKHCYNNIQDVGEEGIDCGGLDCISCSDVQGEIQTSPPEPESFWSSNTGIKITNARISDTVQLVFDASDLEISGEVLFKIREKDLISDDDIITITPEKVGNKYIAQWRITKEDYDLAVSGELENEADFYFVAFENVGGGGGIIITGQAIGGQGDIVSGQLLVSGEIPANKCSDPEQIIVKLSGVENALAQKWDYSSVQPISSIEQGLVAHYNFDNNADDASGNNNNGVVYGASFVPGKTGNALSFDGNDYVNVGNKVFSPTSINTEDFSVSFWIKPSYGLSSDYVLSKRNYGEGAMYIRAYKRETILIADSFVNIGSGYNQGPETDQWTHIALVCKRGNLGEYYKDGVKRTARYRLCSQGDISNSGDLYIGRYINAYFRGDLDELRIYEKALTGQEISEIYSGLSQQQPLTYDYEVCYNNIFGEAYDTMNNPLAHDCSAGNENKVLGLSDVTDALGEIPSLSTYTTNVCYDDLECLGIRGECPLGFEHVVSLSSETNARFAYSVNETSVIDEVTYPVKICCKGKGAVSGNAFWAPQADTNATISEASIGSTINLVFSSSLKNGENISFEILEKDILTNNPVKTGENSILAVISGGIAVGSWTITQEDFDNSGDLLEGTAREFFFKVYYKNLEINQSDVLNVYGLVNTPPVSVISSPKEDERFPLNQEIPFTENSYDVEGAVSVLWDFGDGITSSESSVLHLYDTLGEKTVILTATDSEGLKSVLTRKIWITKGKGLVSNIQGDIPFYTSDSNPAKINLGKDENQIVTWQVTPTGIGLYDMYAYANVSSNPNFVGKSSSININILGIEEYAIEFKIYDRYSNLVEDSYELSGSQLEITDNLDNLVEARTITKADDRKFNVPKNIVENKVKIKQDTPKGRVDFVNSDFVNNAVIRSQYISDYQGKEPSGKDIKSVIAVDFNAVEFNFQEAVVTLSMPSSVSGVKSSLLFSLSRSVIRRISGFVGKEVGSGVTGMAAKGGGVGGILPSPLIPITDICECANWNFNTGECDESWICSPASSYSGFTYNSADDTYSFRVNKFSAYGGAAPPACVPKTCADLGKSCDLWDDGCGNILNCGTCGVNEECTGGICLSSGVAGECTDECSAGETRCSGSSKQTCGDYNSDNCVEWGGSSVCDYGCSNGNCESAPSTGDECSDECSAGDKECSGNTLRTCGECDDDNCKDFCITSCDYKCENSECVGQCTEDWECTEWSECISELQNRECDDNNNCGTEENKPDEERDCLEEVEYPYPIIDEECIPEWNVSEWTECRVNYTLQDLINGKQMFEGIKERIWTDLSDCRYTFTEPRYCNLSIDVTANRVEWCDKVYVEVRERDTNKPVARIQERKLLEDRDLDIGILVGNYTTGKVSGSEAGNRRVINIGFIISNFTGYCDYCFDSIKNYDEEGVDCGLPNCPACVEYGKKYCYIPKLLVILSALTVIVYLFYLLKYKNRKFLNNKI